MKQLKMSLSTVFLRRAAVSWRLQRAATRSRTAVTAASGALLSKPVKHYSFGLARLILVIAPLVYGGTELGRIFATSLEEYDLFVPDDDDDD